MSDKLRWWEDPEQIALLWKRFQVVGMDRREFIRIVGAVGGTTGVALAAAACQRAPEATPTPVAAVTPPPVPTPTPPRAVGPTPTTAPAPTPAAGELAADQVFRTNMERDPQSFDFNRDLYCEGDASCFAMLGMFTPDLEVVPDIAERWEPNQDASVWTFYIRKDSYWSNGDPVTARDYEWSWKRQLDPATAAPYAGFLYDIKNAEAFNTQQPGVTRDDVGVKALDDYTLQVTLEGPRGYFPILAAYIAAAPAHRPSVEKYGDKWTEAENIVCNGPFKLVRWEHDKIVVLEKNEKYWNAKNITLQRVERPIIPSEAVLQAYENNEIDWMWRGPLGQLERIRSDPKLSKEYHQFNLFGTWYLVPDPKFEPYNLKEVRRAMAHAIDRETIVKQVLKGLATVAYTFTPPGMPYYIEPDDKIRELTEYNPDKARQWLKGTPYEGGKNWPKGLTLTHREEGDAPKAAAAAIIQMLKEVLGMELEHIVGEPRETYERMWKHEIPLMWVRWYVDYPDPANTLFQVWYSKAPTGRRHEWSNEEFDRLTLQANGESDPKKRYELYYKAQLIQLEEAAAIYVYNPWSYGLMKPWVANLPRNRNGDFMPEWNIFIRHYDYYKILKQ
ncbi:MAG: peptide ABC transporter substrate-binding protein [Thermomicrobium sp.]|uniref:peptide ABC transporter substrate-binding protein n=1 Tax=Thermomicrobium sp. TaxID=1969469 RepID=UPI001AFE2978|nr:peptide ABC transporter substrate-binding protein [Thermomicrobium sp.]MBO9351075.1 peptide ABC transporter substrate-binding protein [Thermomicrobium sp.]